MGYMNRVNASCRCSGVVMKMYQFPQGNSSCYTRIEGKLLLLRRSYTTAHMQMKELALTSLSLAFLCTPSIISQCQNLLLCIVSLEPATLLPDRNLSSMKR